MDRVDEKASEEGRHPDVFTMKPTGVFYVVKHRDFVATRKSSEWTQRRYTEDSFTKVNFLVEMRAPSPPPTDTWYTDRGIVKNGQGAWANIYVKCPGVPFFMFVILK